MTQKLFSV